MYLESLSFFICSEGQKKEQNIFSFHLGSALRSVHRASYYSDSTTVLR